MYTFLLSTNVVFKVCPDFIVSYRTEALKCSRFTILGKNQVGVFVVVYFVLFEGCCTTHRGVQFSSSGQTDNVMAIANKSGFNLSRLSETALRTPRNAFRRF